MFDAYPGETIRIIAADLTRLGVPVTADASVIITILDKDNLQVDQLTASNDVNDNDWYADFNAPMIVGQYQVKFAIDLDGSVRKRKTTLTVRQF